MICVDELVAFSRENPWKPQWPEALIRRFLGELISSPEMVLELRAGERLRAAGVLVDRLLNPDNLACLEVLGVAKGVEPLAALSDVLNAATQRIPQNRAGFQVGFHESLLPPVEWLESHGLAPGYATYEMWRGKGAGAVADPEVSEIELLTDHSSMRELYDVLTESFRQNPDTSIPPFEEWVAHRMRSTGSLIWVWVESRSIVGFVNVTFHEEEGWAEVSTIGVLPRGRGRGIGRALLAKALAEIALRGIARVRLSVAVKNKRALGLYQGLGFQVSESYQVFYFQRDPRLRA